MTLPDIWRAVSERIGFYTKETRDQIPEAPGCYAWFVPLWIYFDSLTQMVEYLNRLVLYDPLTGGKVTSIAKFNWDFISVEVEKLCRSSISAGREAEWSRVMGDPKLKAAFQQALMEASILMPPLYVGKADNLRARYMQHVSGPGVDINVFHTRFMKFIESTPLPLAVSDLLFVCIQTDPETDVVLREANLHELLEYILMLLCRPPFSMR